MAHTRIFGVLFVTLGLLGSAVSAQTLVETVQTTQIGTTLNQNTVPGRLRFTAPSPSAPTPPASAAGSVTAPPATVSPAAPQSAGTQSAGTQPGWSLLPARPVTPALLKLQGEAQASLLAGQFRAAQQGYERLVSSDYRDPGAHFGLGLALYGLGDLNGATFEFTQLTQLAPGRFEGPYNLGVVQSRQGNSEAALASFTQAAALARGTVSPAQYRQILEAQAGEQARRKDYAALSSTLTELLSTDPADPELQYRLAQALAFAGQGTQALALLYAVRQAQPGNADAALLTADIYAAQGLTERAVRELDSAIAPAPDGSARARLLLRKSALTSGAVALQAALDASQADSRSALAFARLGELRVLRGDRAGGLKAWQTAAELEPRSALYRANVAAVHLAAGRTAQAVQDARAALKLSPDAATTARAQYLLGVAAYRQGAYSTARSALQSSVLGLQSAETLLWLGLTDYALKDYVGAVTALEASVKLDPNEGARVNLGSALLSAGRYPEAESTLRAVVVSSPRNAAAWYLLGISRRAQGQTVGADSALRTAANLGDARARTALRP